MMDRDDEWSVSLGAFDMSDMRDSLYSLNTLAHDFGRSLTHALKSASLEGQSLSAVLRGLARDLSAMALKSALQPLQNGLSQGLQGIMNQFLGASMPVQPFAKGGVVAAPAYFPLNAGASAAASMGLMGEAGAEAILPLARGADGRLGVRAGQSAPGPVQVSVTINARDAESFRHSEAYLSAMLARAVARGQRGA